MAGLGLFVSGITKLFRRGPGISAIVVSIHDKQKHFVRFLTQNHIGLHVSFPKLDVIDMSYRLNLKNVSFVIIPRIILIQTGEK